MQQLVIRLKGILLSYLRLLIYKTPVILGTSDTRVGAVPYKSFFSVGATYGVRSVFSSVPIGSLKAISSTQV